MTNRFSTITSEFKHEPIKSFNEMNSDEKVKELLENVNPCLIYDKLMQNTDLMFSSNTMLYLYGDESFSGFVKEATLPNSSLGELSNFDRKREPYGSYTLKLPDDRITVGNLSVTLFCDSEMILYEKFKNLQSMESQREIEFLLNFGMFFFDSNRKNTFFQIFYKDCYISDVSGLAFDNSSQTNLTFTCEITVNEEKFIRNSDNF